MTHRLFVTLGLLVAAAATNVAAADDGAAAADARAVVRPDRTLAGPPRKPQLERRRSVTSAHHGPFAPTSEPSLNGSPVAGLILTSDTMRPAFERLAAWKTAKGVPTVVRTLAQVEAAGLRGSDLAETLRNYIRAAYQDWGIETVLLGGDTEVVPTRTVRAEFLGLSNPVTDLYFSCLDGNWNADGDAAYGEAWISPQDPGDDADLESEVALGRAPVSTLAEADLFVDKALGYERPQLLDFQAKVLLLAEVLFPSAYAPGTPISIDGATFAENLRAILPPATPIDRLYETSEFYPGSAPLTRAASRSAINAGYGTVVHIGHGYRYTLSVGDASLDVGDAAAFTNQARAGLVYMLNCTAAAFDFESFAETLLLNTQGGAALVIGAAREAFPVAAADYQEAFFTHVYTKGERRVGFALAESRAEFLGSAFLNSVDRWTQLTYTLLGDPETPLWTATPRAIALAAAQSVQVGAQDYAVTVTDAGQPLAGARVCAASPGDVYAVATTNAAGVATLRVEPRTTGTLTLTATAPDRIPVQATRAITLPAPRALVLAGAGLDDDGGTSGSGNQDGRLDAGETVRLGLPLRNPGTLSHPAVTAATLSSTDPDVVILAASSSYSLIGPGKEVSAAVPFEIRIPASVSDGRVVRLRLRLQSTLADETREVELLVHAARPQLVSLRVSDTRAGNGNGVQEPGEEIDLYYTIANRGSGTAEALALELAALEPGLEVLAGTAAFTPLAPGATAESPLALTVREADPAVAHLGQLVLRHFQNPGGAARRIDLRPPQAPAEPRFVAADQVDAAHVEWATSADVDLLGYHVERRQAGAGAFARANSAALQTAYFRDTGLAPSSRYDYRIVAVDSTLLASAPGATAQVSTNPPVAAGWPLSLDDRTASSPAVADVDGDGDLDIVGAARQIYAWDAYGIELRDADQSPVTWGLFYGAGEAFGSITLADLDPVPGKEIVAVTWDATQRYAIALRRDGTPLPGWPRPLVPAPDAYRGAQVGPVVANLDDQGAPEILVAARDGRLYGWHANGQEIADGDGNPATQGVLLDTGSPFLRSAPAVADLDPARPGLEIVVGGTDGRLHVIGANGSPLPGWPRAFAAYFASGGVIADLDRDGTLELVILDASGALHALHLDGQELAGFPVTGIRGVSQSTAPSPAIGNVTGDADLEIVACGSDGKLRILNAAGVDVLPAPGYLLADAETESSPILGDVDGDPGIEILLGDEEGVLHAWNVDGTLVDGFPIAVRSEIRATPTLGDVDGDGNADLVALSWDGVLNVWDLGVPWNPARAPWPTARGDVHRTGQFGYSVPTPVAVSDLHAAYVPGAGVRIAWRAATSGAGDPDWVVFRAGPFTSEPLATAVDIVYSGTRIGERRGTGILEFVDADVEPGAWYAYVLEWRDAQAGESAVAGPVTVATTASLDRLRFLPGNTNPMRPGTPLRFEIPARSARSLADVQVTLYDARGRRVRRLVEGPLGAGVHAAVWDGRDDGGARVASGVYVARLTTGGSAVTRKIAWLR